MYVIYQNIYSFTQIFHLRFTEELEREATCAKIAQVQIEGNRSVTRTIPYFNLDMIISVGYRVNSKLGVQFHQWANRVLKQYLVKGYTVNERRVQEHYTELRQLVQILGITNKDY